jgi:hypothetical protein
MMQARKQAQMAQAQGQPAPPPPDMSKVVTIEQVGELLANQKTRPFALDIETDSTIAPNEAEEKASRIEFITAVSTFIAQAGQMVVQQPETAPFMGEMLKFTAQGFRAGRQLGGAIDEFVEQVTAKASAPQEPKPDPAMLKVEADGKAKEAELQLSAQKAQGDMQIKQAELQLKARELDMKERENQTRAEEAMISQGLPPGYNFAQHQEQMSMLAASVTQGQQQTAQALAAMAQGLAMMAQAQAAPKRVVRGPDGAVMGVETVAG